MDWKAFVTGRLAQLLARYLGVGLTALAAKLNVTVDPNDETGFYNVIAVFVVAGLCFVWDLVAHYAQKQNGNGDGGSPPVGTLRPGFRFGLCLCLLPLLLAGCFRPPPAVDAGKALMRQAYLNVADNEQKIIETLLNAYREQCYAAIEVAVASDLAEGARRAGEKADTAQTMQFVSRVYAARETKRAEVDAKVAEVRAIVAQARTDLLIAAKLEEALDRFDGAGIDISAVQKAVDDILGLLKKNAPATPKL